jgi:hypothetical protein
MSENTADNPGQHNGAAHKGTNGTNDTNGTSAGRLVSGTGNRQRRSHLFLVRLWAEEDDQEEAQQQWQGKVQHVITGRTDYFPNWTSLVDVLLAMLPNLKEEDLALFEPQGRLIAE